MGTYTITSLKRWSCLSKDLPGLDLIKSIHVYDFDNTLFQSPLPNPKLWSGLTVGRLQESHAFANGGWWHDPNLLAATGEGVEREEPRAWHGWWNEQIASLVELSMQQKDALNVLLTGRSEHAFSDLIKKMVASKKLEFDMVCLKPEVGPKNQPFTSTMLFKKAFLEDLVRTYANAEDVRVYEDRPKHVKAFRDFFSTLNRSFGPPDQDGFRNTFHAEVIQVSEGVTALDPVAETAEIQRMVNEHNASLSNHSGTSTISQYGRLKIKRTILFTGYLISPEDSTKLLSLAPVGRPEGDLKPLANSILITPRPCPRSILDKVGGIGHKLTWEVTGLGSLDGKLWAARCRPVPETAQYHTDSGVPNVVLSLRKGARPADVSRIQHWQPVRSDRALKFETTVGEKVLLRVEDENPGEGEWESLFPTVTKAQRRKHVADSDSEQQRQPTNNNHHNQQHSYNYNHNHPRGGWGGQNVGPNHSGGGRGGHPGPARSQRGGGGRGSHRGPRGGGRGGRGGGGPGRGGYRSLDDLPVDRDHGAAGGGGVWVDGPPPPYPGSGRGGDGGYMQY